jgi:hypothetical protein
MMKYRCVPISPEEWSETYASGLCLIVNSIPHEREGRISIVAVVIVVL